MTLAEIDRYARSQQRIQKIEAKERATYDWLLADLIGRSVARIHSSTAKMPELIEAYPAIFQEDIEQIQERKAEKQAELSAIRFRQFAHSFNKRFEEVAENK